MRKGFVVRDRSLTSLPSKQLSSHQFPSQKQTVLQTYRSKFSQPAVNLMSEKQEDISKLKVNLDHALRLAVNQAIQSSRNKQESIRSTHGKIRAQKKYLQVTEELNEEKMQKMKIEGLLASTQHSLGKQLEEKKRLAEKQQHTEKEFQKLKKQIAKISLLQQKAAQIEPLKARIKTLQLKIRQQKLKGQQIQHTNKTLEKTIEELKQKVSQAKPYQQQLLQRIAFLERVNLQLQRKMQDFNRRQHDYKKQIQHYKISLTKMTADRNKFKENYQTTSQILEEKLSFIVELQAKIAEQKSQIQGIQQKLKQKSLQSDNFSKKLAETIQFYKNVAEQNILVKKRNTVLQQHQEEVRKALAAHIRVSQQTNLYIIERNSQVLKLQSQKKNLLQSMEELEKKFIKLDRLFEQGSARGETQIKESYYGMIREKDKLKLLLKQSTEELAVKILKFGEQRDVLLRKVNAYEAPLPKDETLLQSIIADKIELILMLQSSNDQLIKVKNQQNDRIRQLEKQNDGLKKQMQNLRLRAAELFKIKKDLQQSKSKCERYQDMIQQSKSQITDLNSQLDVLRAHNSEGSEKIFSIGIENKNLNMKIQQLEEIMQSLDVGSLNAKKAQNQINSRTISDSIQKIQNGIKSLNYYFSCCFCDEPAVNLVTLAVCGHNYCTKCKQAYAQYCYQCDNGQPIEKVYSSKFLKEAAGKYRFLVMVMKQAQNNIVKINVQQVK